MIVLLDTGSLGLITSSKASPAAREANAWLRRLLGGRHWALARQRGMATAGDTAQDGDMILSAQAVLIEQAWQQQAVIATTNIRHLARFATAREWQDVP